MRNDQEHGAITAHERAARHALAHDLRSPIRAVAIFADLLATELGSSAPDPVRMREFCDRITDAAAELTGRVDTFADGEAER